MRQAIKSYKQPYATKGTRLRKVKAAFIPNPKGRRHVGTIIYCKSRMGGGSVAHESIHAAIGYLALEGKRPAKMMIDEERLAELTDGIVRSTYTWVYDNNIVVRDT